MTDRRGLPPALVAEAKTKPGGWVYEIVGDYGAEDAVPATAIRGAWKVGDDGEIVGDFLPNPVFEPPAGLASLPRDEGRRPDGLLAWVIWFAAEDVWLVRHALGEAIAERAS